MEFVDHVYVSLFWSVWSVRTNLKFMRRCIEFSVSFFRFFTNVKKWISNKRKKIPHFIDLLKKNSARNSVRWLNDEEKCARSLRTVKTTLSVFNCKSDVTQLILDIITIHIQSRVSILNIMRKNVNSIFTFAKSLRMRFISCLRLSD